MNSESDSNFRNGSFIIMWNHVFYNTEHSFITKNTGCKMFWYVPQMFTVYFYMLQYSCYRFLLLWPRDFSSFHYVIFFWFTLDIFQIIRVWVFGTFALTQISCSHLWCELKGIFTVMFLRLTFDNPHTVSVFHWTVKVIDSDACGPRLTITV